MYRPYAHARYEFFFMRLLFAWVVLYSTDPMLPSFVKFEEPLSGSQQTLSKVFPGIVDSADKNPGIYRYKSTPEPTGMAHFLPGITVLSNPTVAFWTQIILVAAVVLYISGFVLPIALLVITFIHCAIFTLNNSMGATHHGYQIISITLLAQTVVFWLPWGYRLFKKRLELPEGIRLQDWAIYYSQLVIATCYIIAAVSKLLASGVMWIVKSPLIAVQIHKSFDQKYYEYLDPKWLEEGPKYADFAVNNPNLTRLILGGGLVLEAVAFLVLRSRLWALMIGVSLIVMHRIIGHTMALHFPTNEQVDLVFLVNLPFWIVFAYAWVTKRRMENPLATG